MVIAVLMAPTCSFSSVGQGHKWLSGEYRVKPVLREQQSEAVEILGGKIFAHIELSVARAMLGNNNLSESLNYYVATIGYVGKQISPDHYPAGLSVSVDVDSEGIAYVASHRLTSEHETSKLAVVIDSQTPLKGVVSLCSSAE